MTAKRCSREGSSFLTLLPHMDTGPFFRIVNEPGLWMHERCVEVEMEDAEPILCSVVATNLAAAASDFKTVMRQLEETLREDMEKRAESESRKVTSKWLNAPEDWASRPLASRRAEALKDLHYVRVPHEHGPEHWRRTLDRL